MVSREGRQDNYEEEKGRGGERKVRSLTEENFEFVHQPTRLTGKDSQVAGRERKQEIEAGEKGRTTPS